MSKGTKDKEPIGYSNRTECPHGNPRARKNPNGIFTPRQKRAEGRPGKNRPKRLENVDFAEQDPETNKESLLRGHGPHSPMTERCGIGGEEGNLDCLVGGQGEMGEPPF